MLAAGTLHSEPHPLWDSRRLWSLRDMIDFQMHRFLNCLCFLESELRLTNSAPSMVIVSPEDHQRIKNNIDTVISPVVAMLRSETTRLASIVVEDILNRYTRKPYTFGEMHAALVSLDTDFRESAKDEYFFHYPREIAKLWFSIEREWTDALAAFPGATEEIKSGIDCYAMQDYPGCVFHMTRLAELGLRAIAKELKVRSVKKGKPIQYAMWGEVISALQTAVDDLRSAKGNTKPLNASRRDRREAQVERYSIILSDIQAILPLRDRNSHYRNKYDAGEGFTAMNRVKEMMNLVARRL